MAATAPSPTRSALRFINSAAGFEYGGLNNSCVEIHAVIACPEDAKTVDAFLKMLDRFDPSVPRSDELTTALITVLSVRRIDVWKAEVFAQQSLKLEINAWLTPGEENMVFPPDTVSLIVALLTHCRISCVFLEEVMTSLRKNLLEFAQSGATVGKDQMQLAEAMARHSFLNEYLWDETEAEQAAVTTLATKITEQIKTGAAVSAFDLFLVGAYRPLYGVDAVKSWVRNLARQNIGALDASLRLLVLDRLLEDETVIDAITPITSEVSKDVQSQYEENPYPRWRQLPDIITLSDVPSYVAASTGQYEPLRAIHPHQAKVLVAGAGTGAHPISVAQALPHAAVLGIDLSRASLAYATREAIARGVKNVGFAQADILKLAEADVAFDLIESVGVLHHMEDPEAGLKALLKVLKPGGHLRLALYSKTARHAVNAARAKLADAEYGSSLSDIRAFRRDLIRSDDPDLMPLRSIRDFFSTSEFRDLVMHVQEHQFTLEQIKTMMKRNGLKFLGFSSQSAQAALRKMPPKIARKRIRDLEAWKQYEKRHPDTFINMYDFFCEKR